MNQKNNINDFSKNWRVVSPLIIWDKEEMKKYNLIKVGQWKIKYKINVKYWKGGKKWKEKNLIG